MRQQYHSRIMPNGESHIWDVNILVAQHENSDVLEVKLSDIQELEENYWFQKSVDIPTCKAIAAHAKLMEETDLNYPILLCPEGGVMDGMHRVCKAWMEGKETIQAIQLATMPEPDYINVDLRDLPY